jgi:LPS export ABC transporter protein LptC
MKPQQSEPAKDNGQPGWPNRCSSGRFYQIAWILLAAMLILGSCENDLEKIRTVTSIDHSPDASGKNYEIFYSDSFRVKVRILAPEIERYARVDEPYINFPKGMTAYFYNDSLKIEAYIKAKHVVYYEQKHLWEARNNVEGRNLANGNQINTEHMFWDEEKNMIYSHTRSRIVNEDGTFYGENGFEARQDLSWYRLLKSKGVVTIKDE